SPAPEGTRVNWQGEANVFGKLVCMAGGMLEPLGRKNLQALVNGLQRALGDQVAMVVPETAARPGNTAAPENAGTASPTAPHEESAGAERSLPHGLLQNVQTDSGEAIGEANHG